MISIVMITSACLHKGFRTRKQGITLVETVIAMALITFVLIGAYSLLISSISTMRRTEENLYVTRLLETAIEMTRNLSFADIEGDANLGIAGYAASSPISFNTDSTLLTGADGEILYRKGSPEDTDPQAEKQLSNASGQIFFQKINDDLYKVTAAVTWTPYRLSPSTRSVTTYIARQGINRR